MNNLVNDEIDYIDIQVDVIEQAIIDLENTINKGSNTLPGTGEPNSSADLIDSETGDARQRRYYDENGKAAKDIDYFHPDSNNNHEFSHEHYWNWDKKGKHKKGDWC